jgi:SSS family solute:Na+ symporter
MRSKVFTMPEYLERRFNPGCRWILTGISVFAYIFTKISVSIWAAVLLIRNGLGVDISIWLIAGFLVAATGIYTITGGLKAVIYTDLVQAIVLVGGSVTLTVIGLDKVGWFGGLRAALPEDFFHMIKPAGDAVYPWPGTTIGVLILGIWYWCTDQVIVQRGLGTKSLTHSRGACIMTAFLKVLPLFIFVVPGLIARVYMKEQVEKTPDLAYPMLVTTLLPKGLVGLMVAALLAALMSSLSSVFNSCSTLITMDVYRKIKPGASERTLVFVGRLTTAAIVILSIAWIPYISKMSNQLYQYLQSVQAVVGAPIAAVFLVGILFKRATGKAALITLIGGSAVGIVRFGCDILGKIYPNIHIPWLLSPELAFLNYCVLMFFVCVAAMIVISFFTERPGAEKTADLTFSSGTISAGVGSHWLWIHLALTVLVMLIAISIWAHFG